MINPTGKKLQKIISKMIDDDVEGVDKYTLNGSTWLIFTDQKRWVIEYTSDNILWYNYSFFTEIFDLLSMKATDNQNLIQEWFESKFLNINPVEYTRGESFHFNRQVEDTIQEGVKETELHKGVRPSAVEDTIQNGVKHTKLRGFIDDTPVEYTIQNGVKETVGSKSTKSISLRNTIKNGVKETNPMDEWVNSHNIISDVMDYGNIEMVGTGHATDNEMNDVIENGVKEIGYKKTPNESFTNHIIEDGVKETKENRLLRTASVMNTILYGVKQIHDDHSNNIARVEGVIRIGEKLN